jgi:amidase
MNRREFVEGVGALTAAASAMAPAAQAAATGGEFEVREQTIAQLSKAQSDGRASAESLTRSYLSRIERFNRKGPELRAVLAVNPSALEAARALDAARRAGKVAGPLHGIPILLLPPGRSRSLTRATIRMPPWLRACEPLEPWFSGRPT